MNLFLGTPGATAAQGGANAYRYGLATEVKVNRRGKTEVAKHYALGRLSNELAHVMPDGRTVYKGDDGRDVMLAMFVADQRGDLSAGTLYGAKLEQTDGSNGGAFNIHWIRLGHATDGEIRSRVDSGIQFSDMFEVASKADYAANPAAFPGFRPVYTYTGTGGSTRLEYLKVKPGMEQAAAFLETRRYAAYMGATTEFTKMEGATSNRADKKLYLAMSYVEKGMLDGQNGERPQDDIRLSGDPKDLACGIVYEADLKAGMADTAGESIRSRWVASGMRALLLGAQKPADQTAYGVYDRCDTDKMANPDNLKYSEGAHTLFVGEDSGNHLNNFLWAYNLDGKTLTRIASNRAGAEWTGLQAVDNLNGFAYIMSNVQHPGGEDDLSYYKSKIPDFDAFRAGIDQRGTVGYIGGLPALGKDREGEGYGPNAQPEGHDRREPEED
jgi:secreted PhoX family phosphatase